MLNNIPNAKLTQANDKGMNTFQLHTNVCYTCRDMWALVVPVTARTCAQTSKLSYQLMPNAAIASSATFFQSEQSSSKN